MLESAYSDLEPISDREFQDLRRLILEETGISLKETKRMLVQARLAKRLRSLGLASYGAYFEFVSRPVNAGERGELINCITTNKTDFFREKHHFEFLATHVIGPARQRITGGPRRLRLWSAGCSSGEEPYTMAITILETIGSSAGWDIKILASDIDTDVLAKGEAGIYEAERLNGIPEATVNKYFRRVAGERFAAKENLKELIRFRQINFADPAWPVRARFDAIFCRNVIIYFDRETQQRLLERLARYLEPSGYLMMGHSENLFWVSDHLAALGNTIYQQRQGRPVG
ncbi:MAG TPA: protein-glutamate O-methyltransferase CheR [Bryobacteraceae bacterium]|nr:protein-glutamate O-methyltransferase CheR [Bryobacteraceae bacterium]